MTRTRTGTLTATAGVLIASALLIGAGVAYQTRYNYNIATSAAPAPAALTAHGPTPSGTATPDTVPPLLAAATADPALGQLAGIVSDAATGTTLWSHNPTTALIPASSTKLLTATAALLTLPADSRVATTVTRGTTPGTIILHGQGDVTLAATRSGAFYTQAATIEDLAHTITDTGTPITRIIVDNSHANTPSFNPTWDHADIAAGNVTSLDGLMLDGGRQDPTNPESPRTETPAADAGAALARALGIPLTPDTVTVATTLAAGEDTGEELARVESAPLDIRIKDMLVHSDNMEAEALGRQLALAAGKTPSFESATATTLDILTRNGFDLADVVLKDNSGMSADNRITPQLLDALMLAAAKTTPRLRPLLDALPVAAGSGTLRDRYTVPSSRGGAGWVRAKTGTLSGVSALVGTVITEKGQVLTFALMSNGGETAPARQALDTIAAILRQA